MLLITTLVTPLAVGGPPTPAPQARSAAPAEYVAGPQDVLKIVVFGEEDLTKTVSLDADGTFDYPHVGRVKAGGLTARAIGEEIAPKLKNFYVNPQVSVEVAKFRSQNIFVFGQVHAPGQPAVGQHVGASGARRGGLADRGRGGLRRDFAAVGIGAAAAESGVRRWNVASDHAEGAAERAAARGLRPARRRHGDDPESRNDLRDRPGEDPRDRT